jgi:hypothetical protein
MNINEKRYKRKSPEAIALESTVSHHILFLYKDIEDVVQHAVLQDIVDANMELKAQEIMAEEERRQRTNWYVT